MRALKIDCNSSDEIFYTIRTAATLLTKEMIVFDDDEEKSYERPSDVEVNSIVSHIRDNPVESVYDPEDDDDTPDPKTIVAVEVFDTKTGATHYWSLEKLR